MLTRYSVELSYKLSIPKIIIGMTIVSFATSAPELIVSLNATMMGYSDFALGNVLGSNIANLGLVQISHISSEIPGIDKFSTKLASCLRRQLASTCLAPIPHLS